MHAHGLPYLSEGDLSIHMLFVECQTASRGQKLSWKAQERTRVSKSGGQKLKAQLWFLQFSLEMKVK